MPQSASTSKVALLERQAKREREARKRAEALLEEKSRELYLAKVAAESANREKSDAELRYRGLFETAKDPILLLDLQTSHVTDINSALITMLGLAPSRILGRVLWELNPFKNNAACRTMLQDLESQGHVQRDDWVLETPDGRALAVEVVGHVYQVNGARIAQLRFRDVGDERLREQEAEELEHASELLRRTAGVYLWRYNPDAGEYEIDPDFSRRFSEAPQDRRIAAGHLEAGVHVEDRTDLEDPFKHSVRTGEGGAAEYRYLAPNRTWRRVRSAWSGGQRLASGQWEVMGVTQDLTELMAERDRAQAGAEAKSRFLANISHELRTPMNGMLGILHLLLTAEHPDVRARLLTEALASGSRLSDLLNDIVAFSDLEAERLAIHREPTDVAQVLEAAIGPLREQAQAKGLGLRVETEANIGLLALDAARLRQLLFSLVANAVKFTDRGGIDVRVAIRGQGDSTRLRIEIEDTGVGISEGAREGLFSGFVQADGSTTRRFGGAGLGLAIARRLAVLMGGEVDFTSREGLGSTFWVEIAAPACAEKPGASDSEMGWLQGLRVLVVEDNPTNRLVATSMLSLLGAEVVTADDGSQGVEAASREAFDLIFMDIQMPVMDGIEATRRIRALPAPSCLTPIVATTANVLSAQLDTYREVGMNGCVAKPISPT
ncbi:ATP-binding protein, partial [Phenylobacterium sp.]|uniref:ATP-binding protein n=1 Tax=Phenylobacterium sp. TaxID=1871053 RepID=UPI002FCA6253